MNKQTLIILLLLSGAYVLVNFIDTEIDKREMCRQRGIEYSGQPWSYSGSGTMCTMAITEPNKAKKPSTKPHKWMI